MRMEPDRGNLRSGFFWGIHNGNVNFYSGFFMHVRNWLVAFVIFVGLGVPVWGGMLTGTADHWEYVDGQWIVVELAVWGSYTFAESGNAARLESVDVSHPWVANNQPRTSLQIRRASEDPDRETAWGSPNVWLELEEGDWVEVRLRAATRTTAAGSFLTRTVTAGEEYHSSFPAPPLPPPPPPPGLIDRLELAVGWILGVLTIYAAVSIYAATVEKLKRYGRKGAR